VLLAVKIFFKLFCYIILGMSWQHRVRNLINLDIKKEIILLGKVCSQFSLRKDYVCLYVLSR